MRLIPVFVFSLMLASLGAAESITWKSLFNGKDLSGWHSKEIENWKVVDGAIVGQQAKAEKNHGLLVSDKTYKNFVLRGKFKVVAGDSGLYFRVEINDTRVGIRGFQAEVDQSPEVCGLYETSGRQWVKKPDPKLIKKIVKHGDWNAIEVTAVGDDITVSLNGLMVTELLGDKVCLKSGHIALQLHGGQKMHVEFKDLEILELP